MRLQNVSNGHSLKQKVMLGMFRVMARRPIPDVIRVLLYRPEYMGDHLSALIHEGLRGDSEWTACERELFAAYTARLGDCVF